TRQVTRQATSGPGPWVSTAMAAEGCRYAQAKKGKQGQLDYLEERGAIDAAIETFERAWSEYEAYQAAQTDT
ncbi:hypothetical protein, partial [Streptomyces sp. 1222.5]|uniref:hypothetical protein n=1 Tax=Streptomyces sp. 1222.5 TaxID=1881026 RepID=UPI003D7122F5